MTGADGGNGGDAFISADGEGSALAVGGPGGGGGYILFNATSQNCEIFIDQNVVVKTSIPPAPLLVFPLPFPFPVIPPPPQIMKGGVATIRSGRAPRGKTGGRSEAIGGDGGPGGGILFSGGTLVKNLGTLQTSNGGSGAEAEATGGSGANGVPGRPPVSPEDGGPGIAKGGDGGARGGVGPYTDLVTGNVVPGKAGQPGPGGGAVAVPGDGGNGAAQQTGSDSGRSKATGGANGDGVPGQKETSPPEPPKPATPSTGGDGADAISKAAGEP